MVRPEDHPQYWTGYLSTMLATTLPYLKKEKRPDVEDALREFEGSTVISDSLRDRLKVLRRAR